MVTKEFLVERLLGRLDAAGMDSNPLGDSWRFRVKLVALKIQEPVVWAPVTSLVACYWGYQKACQDLADAVLRFGPISYIKYLRL